jgi:UDP-2,3-diacylglucosamine hydrolase
MIHITNNDSRLTINEGAIFIADSHYNTQRNELVDILEQIINGSISTTQLFLMGDIFDFLCSEADYFVKINQKPIEMINQISKKLEVFYFEGNHDYNLQPLFPNVKVFKREHQPIEFSYTNNKICLSHGDIYTDMGYNIYCSIIRNSYLLKFLNLIDFNNFITKKIESSLSKKIICKELSYFNHIVKKRISFYPKCNAVIEGHFHQNKYILSENIHYFNLPSAFCSKSYARMSKSCNFLEEIGIYDQQTIKKQDFTR